MALARQLVRISVTLLGPTLLAGCLSPIAMHRAVLEYGRTVSRVEAEMLLLNIARARYLEQTHFTVVSSIGATFDFRVNAGVAGIFAENPATDSLTLTLGSSVAENPTVRLRCVFPSCWHAISRSVLASALLLPHAEHKHDDLDLLLNPYVIPPLTECFQRTAPRAYRKFLGVH